VIVFSGEKQDRGIRGAVFHVVVGRVGVERLELLGILHRAELGDVECAVGIKFDAQHVIDSDERNYGAEKIGALSESGAHEQAAVAAADDGKLCGRSVFVVDQVLGAGNEITEDILLVGQVAGVVPFLAVLAATAKIGSCADASPGSAPE